MERAFPVLPPKKYGALDYVLPVVIHDRSRKVVRRVHIQSILAAVALLAAVGWTVSAAADDASPAAGVAATPSADKVAITSVLSAYETALNASDIEAIRRLYTEDV